MTPPSIFVRANKLRRVLIAVLFLFAAELSTVIYEQLSETNTATPILHFVIATLFLIILGYSIRRFQITKPSENNTNSLCFSHLPLPAILVNRHGKIRGVNPAAAQSIQRSPASLIDQPVHELFHPHHTSREECLLCQHIGKGQALAPTDFAIARQAWQQISLSKITTGGKDHLLQLHIDITSRKQAEERIGLVIDGARLGYWDWDYVTGKYHVNQHWLNMLGLTPKELDNNVSDWNHRLHPHDRARIHAVIAQHIASRTPYVIEFRLQHKQGHWVWILGSGAVVETDPDSGRPTRLCGIQQDISARKRFENNLEATYQIISQSSSVVLKWNCAEGLPIEFATENVLQLLGYTVEELLTGNVFYLNLIHQDDQAIFSEELNNCRNKQDCVEIAHLPYRIVSRNGSIKWIQDHKVLSRNDQGQVTGYQGLVTDITRQRQQNSAIRNIISSAQEKHTPWTMDNLTLLTAETLTADYTLIGEMRPDRSCRALSFCALTEKGDKTIYTMHPSICAVLATGKICSHPHSISRHFPDDTWLVNHGIEGFIGIPLQTDRQQTVGYVVAMYRQTIPDAQFAEDILKLFAAQIASELERTSAMKALESQKQRLIDAQRISRIGDWQWHWSDNRFSWSDEMYRITGTSRANFIPSFASILTQLIHPDDRNLFKTALQNANTDETIDFKHRIMLRHGEIRHVHQRGKVIHDDQDRAIGIQGTMQDITERLKTEQRLLEAKQAAEKATQVKSEFLANMSHEIRTPMNAIVGLVELCLKNPISNKQRDYLERVETASHSLMSLIDDILDFSKMESGKLSLETVPFLLDEMLDQVFSTMTELANRKHLTLIRPTVDYPYQAVIGDPQRLRQILINLIGNAIKFTKRGRIEVTLQEISRTSIQTTLEFSIIDTGIGMTKEQQAKLFRAFTQGDSSVSRHYGGTGLGLVISKQLIEQMGGTIKVISQEHVGSCFSFTVKLGLADIANIRLSRPQVHKNIDTSRLQYIRGARILLVEDNEVNRIVASELLGQAQLQIDTAENGEIALAKLKRNQYDCVLMDVQMPVMDGYEATRKLRKLPNCSALPVIAMTANVMSDDRNKCLQAGMDDFIGKPILPDTLYAALIKWIKPNSMSNSIVYQPKEEDEIPYLYGIDNAIGLLHTAEDKSVFRKILQKFAENHIDSMSEIEKAISKNDLATARQLTHTLKGLAGSLGAVQLQGHLIRLEELLTDANINTENPQLFNKLITLTSVELNRIINSIQSTLPQVETKTLQPIKVFSAAETQHELEILRDKLQAFDSDADQQLELILSSINQPSLIDELSRIKKLIASYQFVDANNALNQILDLRKDDR